MPAGAIETIRYWYPDLANWLELVTPPQVPVGSEFQLAVWWINLGTVRAKGRIDGSVTKPDGTTVNLSAVANQDMEADPNNGWLVQYSGVVLDRVGDYRGEFVLSMEEVAPAEVTFTLYGYNYPAWVEEEEILIWDGNLQRSGRQVAGTSYTVTIPGDSTNFQFNLFGAKYPGGVGVASAFGGIGDGSEIRMDMSVFVPPAYQDP